MRRGRRIQCFLVLAIAFFTGTVATLNAEDSREGRKIVGKDFSVVIERSENRTHMLKADVAFCSEIANKECAESTDLFTIDAAKIYCHTTVHGSTSYMEIKHLWYQNGKIDQIVRLPVKSSRWRTWSLKALSSGTGGNWRVEVYTGDEKIGEGEFSVAETEGGESEKDLKMGPP